MSLKSRLIEQIRLEGPMNVADYMARCLFDPLDGYYSQNVRLGADGDFITAPLVSQMFGEMIGVWVAQMWQAMGAPPDFRLIEIGGGDGTLMSDILRVINRVDGLRNATRVMMIEPSLRLQALQIRAAPEATHAASLNDVPSDMPVIVIANEVLDCLPARQYVRLESGWAERCVGVVDDDLAFGLIPAQSAPDRDAEPGDIVEISAAQQMFAASLATLLKSATGAALLIDYGRDEPQVGDTLQALSGHQKQSPLAAPGQHDLTVWADFPALKSAVTPSVKSRIVSQRQFLLSLGIDHRLSVLAAQHPEQSEKLLRQYERITSPDHMGSLFKVMGFASPTTLPLFALET